jgi:hypothetical protein
VLDTYTSERSVHVQHAIAMSVEVGRVICLLDEAEAARRDARMIAGEADPARVLRVTALPVLGEGIVADDRGGHGDAPALRGALAPQFPVSREGRSCLSDEFTGQDTVLLLHADTPSSAALDSDTSKALAEGRIRAFSIDAAGTPDLIDDTGSWTGWFAANAIVAALIRPDHYIFGALATTENLGGLVADHLVRLHQAAHAPYASPTPRRP